MKAAPVGQIALPAYPTRFEVAREHNLLRDHVPPGWTRDGKLQGALVFFLALHGAACQSPPVPPSPPSLPATQSASERPRHDSVSPLQTTPSPVGTVPATPEPTASSTKQGPLAGPPPAAIVVAPIFDHGEGRGATGCVVVSPPVFLSEEEAMTVVREELARVGVRLARTHVTFPEVVLPQRRRSYERTPSGDYVTKTEDIPHTGQPIEVDATDGDERIAVEVVSQEHYFKVGGVRSESTVQDYDIKGAAEAVAEKLKQSRRGIYFGVFYDPVATISIDRSKLPARIDWEAARAKAASQAKEQLRAQVADFVAWLHQQGVL
jgi:hypothetical protein